MPPASAFCELAWITGPSAIGSENGTPTSRTSAPAPSSPMSRSTVASRDGCPAVTYGTSARRPDARSCANRSATRSDEVVADTNTVPIGLIRLDDRSLERAVLSAVGEIDQISGKEHVAFVVAHDTHDRPREHFGDRVVGVHQSELEGIEYDESANRIDTGEIDKRLDEDRIHAAAGVIAHLFHDVGRIERRRLIGAARGGGIESVGDSDDL